MFWSKIAMAGAFATVASAHGGINIIGNPRAVRELSRDGLVSHWEHAFPRAAEKRQTVDPENCGPDVGNCQAGYCCSATGWCGNTADHCWAPDCQLDYGDGCDANQKPTGEDTSGVARPKLGKIAYGQDIGRCVNDGDIAITYDDGPYLYTADLLDILKKYKAKATFFINGNNKSKGQINDPDYPWVDVIKRMAAEGHQIASHSWSHQNYSKITEEQFETQVLWNEIAINDILGYFPTYYRPPYSYCPEKCLSKLGDLGYHVIHSNLDTNGLLYDDPLKIQASKDIWDKNVEGTEACSNSFLHLEHDLQHQVVYNLTEYMVRSLLENGYRSVTVGECLGDPAENWYRSGSGGSIPEYNFVPSPGSSECNGNAAPIDLSNIPTETVPPLTSTTSQIPESTGNGATPEPTPTGAASSFQGGSILAMAVGLILPAVIV